MIVIAITLFFIIPIIIQGFSFTGPLKSLATLSITERYNSKKQTEEVVFYGASNFTRWKTMESDLSPYAVQNHGFGGSTDVDLMNYAGRLLYPYKPYAVFLQNGTNDYLSGETAQEMMKYKDKMYTAFREELPDSYFVVLSGLPLPGRSQFWEREQEVNAALKKYCASHDKMLFVDATEALTAPTGGFKPEYFADDGIHLNAAGQKAWAVVIKAALAQINAPKR
jgi:lysophospholipase L1-like esterase